jgi:hypothetical protein
MRFNPIGLAAKNGTPQKPAEAGILSDNATSQGRDMTLGSSASVQHAREEFAFVENCVYLNTAAVAIGSRRLATVHMAFVG